MTYLYMYTLTCDNRYKTKYIKCPITSYNVYNQEFPALTCSSLQSQRCNGSVSIQARCASECGLEKFGKVY